MENTSAYSMIERHPQNDGLRYGGLPGVPLSCHQAPSPWNSMQHTTSIPTSIPKNAKETAIVTDGTLSTFATDHQQYRHKPTSTMTPSTPISQQHLSYQSPPVSPCVNNGVNINGHVVSTATSTGDGPSMSSTTTPTPSSSSSSSSSSYSSTSSGYSPPSSRHWASPSAQSAPPVPPAYSPYHSNQQQQQQQQYQHQQQQQQQHFRQTEQHYYDEQTQPMEAGQYHQLASPSPFMQSPIVSTTRSHSVKRNKLRQATYTRWSLEEDERLKQAVALHGPHKWSLIASHVPNRTPMQCSTRWLGALNPNIHKGRWTDYEDNILKYSVLEYANVTDNQGRIQPIPWNRIAERIPHRTGIQCQARWTEALDPYVRKGKWGADEDHLLRSGVQEHGRCWIRIAETIPGRTQRQCRTRWMQLQCKYSKQQQQQQQQQRSHQQQPSLRCTTSAISVSTSSSTCTSPSGHQPGHMSAQVPYASPCSSIDEVVSPSSTDDDHLGMSTTTSSPTNTSLVNVHPTYANYPSHQKVNTNRGNQSYMMDHELNNAMLQHQQQHQPSYHPQFQIQNHALGPGTEHPSGMNYHTPPQQPVKPIYQAHPSPASDVYSYFNQLSQPFSSHPQHLHHQ